MQRAFVTPSDGTGQGWIDVGIPLTVLQLRCIQTLTWSELSGSSLPTLFEPCFKSATYATHTYVPTTDSSMRWFFFPSHRSEICAFSSRTVSQHITACCHPYSKSDEYGEPAPVGWVQGHVLYMPTITTPHSTEGE